MVIKKEYIKPTMKVGQIENADIICGSTTSFSLNNEEVEEYKGDGEKPDGWGIQW